MALRKRKLEDENDFETDRGLGPAAGGQSGDTQGLPEDADIDSESVEELMEEGQSFEAEVISGVEDAPDADEGEVRTHEVPEDDVPPEYQDRD
jgi:N utilization substance protein A